MREKGKLVKPALLSGFRDWRPDEMPARMQMLNRIETVYRQFGFEPLQTPVLESSQVLGTSDPDFGMKVFRFDAGGQDVTMRFDLTVPLARFVAANPEIPLPLRRYQVGQVYRFDKPQAGRLREFTQFDGDIVGTSSMMADAEIICLIFEIMNALGIGDKVLIRVNNRKLLNALPEVVGFDPRKINPVLRILDKLDKLDVDAVVEELSRRPDNSFDDSAPNLPGSAINKIMQFIELKGSKNNLLLQVNDFMRDSEIGLEGAAELAQILELATVYGIPDSAWTIDLSVARGLAYYTGPVFETTFLSMPSFGSIMSGGRYDDLLSRFTGQSLPAVGASVGIDRLFEALGQAGLLPKQEFSGGTLIANWDDGHKLQRFALAANLRSQGIPCSVYYDGKANLKKQLGYALKRGMKYFLLMGESEVAKGTAKVKDLAKQEQVEVGLDNLSAILLV